MITTIDGVEVHDRPLSGRGGARPGAGKKPAGYVKSQDLIDLDKSKARNEAAKASLNELAVKLKTGEQVDRRAMRQAQATAISSMVQTLRSIPDNLERKLGVTPETAEAVGEAIDNALNELANEFEMMVQDDADI